LEESRMEGEMIKAAVKLLLTPDEAAGALGIKRTKLYHLSATGQIASVKIGALRRFPVEALEAYVRRLSVVERVG
jgi:excisionase family DNA binding protein